MSPSSDEPQNRYPKRPLEGARDIRLVRVLPKTEAPFGFELELSTTSLDDSTSYVALSYTWDAAELDPETGKVAPTLEHWIECHDGSVKVTDNLLDFLQRAAQTVDARETYYWIDQISINQPDSTERSHQVAMMGNIYKAAATIHIWLGKNDPSQEFLWVYRSFIPSVLRVESTLRDQGIRTAVCERWRKSYESFFWFFYIRRWFLRAWILQEVTLKDVSLCKVSCGNSSLDWEVFDAFTHFVERCSWHHSLPFLYVPWAEKFVGPMVPLSNLLKSRRYIDLKARKGSGWDDWKNNFVWDVAPQDDRQMWYSIFLHFLRTTRFMSAKHPRDHIYSLLGMMEEFLPPGMRCPIAPNYKVPTVSVFRDFAMHIFENTPSLYLLSTVSYGINDGKIANPDDRADWPSWVPDFSNETSFGPSLSTTVYMVSSGTQCYNASRLDAIPYDPPTVRGSILTVHGAKIGIVGMRNDRRQVVSGSENLPYLSFILELCTKADRKYPNSEQTWIEAIWRTMMVDCIPASWDTEPPVLFRSWLLEHIVRALKFKGKDHASRAFEDAQERMVDLLQPVSEDSYLSAALPTLDEIVDRVRGHVEQNDVEHHPFELLACESFATGRWYLTTSGYLGSGPVSLVEGDEVWLLKGAKMPMILRRSDGQQYLLVGESYLHGAMYGELMTEDLITQIGPVEII